VPDCFDPYQHWLGIPPAEQPPHHYRLLGIPPFESSPEVIRRAAEQQAAAVRRHQSSEFLAVTNKLLSDITAAAACLLNTQSKAAYDAQLQQQLGLGAGQQRPWQAGGSGPQTPAAAAPPSQPPTPPPPVAGPPPPTSAPPVAPPMAAPPAAPPVAPRTAGRERSSIPWPAVGLVLVALAALAGVLVMVLGDEEPPREAAEAQAPAKPPAADGNPEPSSEAAPAAPEDEELSPPPPDDSEPAGVMPEEPPVEEPVTPQPPPSPVEPEAAVKPKLAEQRGDVEVAVLSATIGRGASATALEEGRLEPADPDAVSLIVNLELRNKSRTEPLKYFPWTGLTAFDVPVAMRDQGDRFLRQKTPVEQNNANEAEANVYVLSEKNFRAKVLEADKPVLVQFYAPWSEGCKSLMPVVDHVSAAYADKVTVGRFQVPDGDEAGTFRLTPLLQKYKVQSIPTVLIFNHGKPVEGWAGVVPLGTMEEALDALLPPKPPAYETLPPGGSVQQRLVFQPPEVEAKFLHLTLPGSAVAVEGTFELVLPGAMVEGGQ